MVKFTEPTDTSFEGAPQSLARGLSIFLARNMRTLRKIVSAGEVSYFNSFKKTSFKTAGLAEPFDNFIPCPMRNWSATNLPAL